MANVQIGRITGTSFITQVLPDNVDRKYAIIVNNLKSEVYLAIGTNPILGNGIPLTTKGSHYEITKDNFTTVEILAIGSANILDLAWQQR